MDGCISVHVNGVPPHCEDADVEAQLRKALDRPGTCGMLAVLDEPRSTPLSELLSALDSQEEEHVAGLSAESEPCASEALTDSNVAEGASEVLTDSNTAEGQPELQNADGDLAGEATGEAAELDTTKGVLDASEDPSHEDEAKLSDSCYSCSVPRKKTGESKGFCFLEFLTLESAEAAIYILNAGVQIDGSVVSAQLARQNAAMVSEQTDKQRKDKTKTAKHNKQEAVYFAPMSIKNKGYNATKDGGPPMRKKGARPIHEGKTATTLLKAFKKEVSVVAERTAMLSLADREKQLELENAQQLRLQNGCS